MLHIFLISNCIIQFIQLVYIFGLPNACNPMPIQYRSY
nr:MAG TPA: hypothetical protein [Caudoviricetes sp.]